MTAGGFKLTFAPLPVPHGSLFRAPALTYNIVEYRRIVKQNEKGAKGKGRNEQKKRAKRKYQAVAGGKA